MESPYTRLVQMSPFSTAWRSKFCNYYVMCFSVIPLSVGNLNIKEVASSIQDGEEEEEEAMADDMDSTNGKGCELTRAIYPSMLILGWTYQSGIIQRS